ncbi:MAG: gamma-glutamylcyclotransferase, partial [Chloroflexi bacterium]|nr:gamma-glutamylcyclotransferase [Chloroflexota bacterium]
MGAKSKQAEPIRPFFVYGTLLSGQPNAVLWQRDGVSAGAALFPNGRLYDMGGYPMLVEGEGGLVKGEIVAVPDGHYTAVLARLDALEGYNPTQPQAPGYRRLARKAVLTDSR